MIDFKKEFRHLEDILYPFLLSPRPHLTQAYRKKNKLRVAQHKKVLLYPDGYTINTYHNIKMKGIEFLRKIYAARAKN